MFFLYYICYIGEYIQNRKVRLSEGELRAKELSDYLEKLKLPKKVWLSEDGSSVIPKIEYDQKSNQLVGIPQPLDKTNGCPVRNSFIAENAKVIEEYMKMPKASNIYFIMAQPIKENVPAMLLQAFGTDNTFTKEDVLKRWRYTKEILKK